MHAIYSHTHNLYKNESKHSEMGPVRQNPTPTVSLFICLCVALCTIVAHNIAQNRHNKEVIKWVSVCVIDID